MKNCLRCKKLKELAAFSKHKINLKKGYKDGFQNYCKKCGSSYYQQHRKKIREKAKTSYLQKTYNISLEDKKNLLILQLSKCAICKKKLELKSTTHIDHDHTSGKIRGILCHNCNRGLGYFKDNPRFLKTAIKYLSVDKNLQLDILNL